MTLRAWCQRRDWHTSWCAQECSILKSLNYDKNIVQFFGAVLRPGVEPMLVLEFMEVRTRLFLLGDDLVMRVARCRAEHLPAYCIRDSQGTAQRSFCLMLGHWLHILVTMTEAPTDAMPAARAATFARR